VKGDVSVYMGYEDLLLAMCYVAPCYPDPKKPSNQMNGQSIRFKYKLTHTDNQ